MKRLCLLFIGLMVMLSTIAQDKLHVASFFKTRFVKSHKASMVKLSGKSLVDYSLLKFYSVTMSLSLQEVLELEKAVAKDTYNATEQESASKHGRLYYGFYFIGTMDFNHEGIPPIPSYTWKVRLRFKI